MTVIFKLVQNKIPGSKANGKWYARATAMGTKTIDDIADEMVTNSTVTRADVLAVLSACAEAVQRNIMNGYRVKIPRLGSFKVGVRSRGASSPDDFSPAKHLCKPVIHFKPDAVYQPELRQYSPRALQGIEYANLDEVIKGKKKNKNK